MQATQLRFDHVQECPNCNRPNNVPVFIHIPTKAALRALHEKAGPMYDAMIEVVLRDNASVTSRDDAGRLLQQLLAPSSVQEVLFQTHISLPSRVKVGGKWKRIGETNPFILIRCTAEYMARRKFFCEQFGSKERGPGDLPERALRGFYRLRQQHGEQGGRTRDTDEYVMKEIFLRPYKAQGCLFRIRRWLSKLFNLARNT
jgi:hypothetical protein